MYITMELDFILICCLYNMIINMSVMSMNMEKMMGTKQESMIIPPSIVLIIKYKAGFKLRHQDTNPL
jgi:hypothetical protein